MKRRIVLRGVGASLAFVAGGRAAFAQQPFTDWYTVITAAAQNKMDDVRTMVGRGDSPNTANGEGRTPLSYAAAFGDAATTKFLIDKGARVDQRDKSGNTPLHWASGGGHTEVVKVLIAAKAPIDAQDKQGITPLMLAASNARDGAVRALLAGGADRKKQDFTGRDAIGWASGHPTVLRLLLAAPSG